LILLILSGYNQKDVQHAVMFSRENKFKAGCPLNLVQIWILSANWELKQFMGGEMTEKSPQNAEGCIFQFLARKFCHDLATPINSIGLILSGLHESKNYFHRTEDLHFLEKGYESLVSLLSLYRILLSNDDPSFGKVLEFIQYICRNNNILYEILDETEEPALIKDEEITKTATKLDVSREKFSQQKGQGKQTKAFPSSTKPVEGVEKYGKEDKFGKITACILAIFDFNHIKKIRIVRKPTYNVAVHVPLKIIPEPLLKIKRHEEIPQTEANIAPYVFFQHLVRLNHFDYKITISHDHVIFELTDWT
jgi:hypothetical protein